MGAKYGLLIPDTYELEVPDDVDMNTTSIFWGLSLGIAIFSATKAGKQTYRSWRRTHRITAYVFMIWAVWFSSQVLGVLAWGFQRGYIAPSFGFYFCVALFWAFQIQFLLQIILNRLGLLIVVPGKATRLKWIVFAIILAVNISVFIIWMPARLQINDTWIHLNLIWDRCEKVIFALVDGVLNGYFIYLVRTRLIQNGLTKYVPLFRLNLFLIFLSLSLDVVLVGTMSLKNSMVYLSFHPVCYLLKLQIELKMSELITKIVRSTGNHAASDDIYYRHTSTNGKKGKSAPTGGKSKSKVTGMRHGDSVYQGNPNTTNITQIEADDEDIELQNTGPGIVKTVETTVATFAASERDPDGSSQSSSTRNLHYP
ncbi:unnamed protein product [Clonostachys rosea f. rosea IK726]|uniref:Integral membrane protein n=3 Tax=Bionectria ochroleuca TaxID=29856 RepID=A0A0B7JJF4_BIOOC|nr:unnamed protein product [Clonostachys rosea f. rosea IK726]